MVDVFGNKGGLIGSLELLVGAAFILGALIFRKKVANDMLDLPFSILGSTIPSILGFIISNNIFEKMKFPLMIAIGLFVAGGFLVGDLLGDGTADGGST